MGRTTRAALAIASVFGLLVTAQVTYAEVNFSIDAGLRQEDNIGFARDSSDEVDDLTLQVGANLQWLVVQTATAEVAGKIGYYYDNVDDISDLSRQGFQVGASYRGQADASLTAVWWQIEGTYKTLDYKDSEIRDGDQYEIVAMIGKRFNEKFGMSVGYRYEERNTDENPPFGGGSTFWRSAQVFEHEKNGGFIRGEFNMGPETVLFGEYTYKTGDEAASGRFGGLGGTIEWGWDLAFGPGVQVWKIDADQNIIDVGIDHQFNDRFSVNGTVSYLDAEGDAGGWGTADYTNVVFTVGTNINF